MHQKLRGTLIHNLLNGLLCLIPLISALITAAFLTELLEPENNVHIYIKLHMKFFFFFFLLMHPASYF